jgi:hypothetical protein
MFNLSDSEQVSNGPIYASLNPDDVAAARQEASAPVSKAPNVSNPMYSSIDGLEARRSFIIRRNDQERPLPRSNSAAATLSMRISQPSVERPPVYTDIIPRNLRKKNQSVSSSEPEEGGGATDPSGTVQGPEADEYSTLKH